jgi:hypothetical protein
MWEAREAAGAFGWDGGIWFAAAVAAPQVAAVAMYLGATRAEARARCRLVAIPLVALAFAALQLRLGQPAPRIAPALVVAAATGIALVGLGGEAIARDGRPAGVALGLMLWAALIGAPAGALGVGAEFGPVLALLTGGAALVAHWPSLAAAYAEPGCEPPLPWFLWSASHGGWALISLAAGMPWPLLAFPFVAQAMTLGIGLVALEGQPAETGGGRRAAR